MRVGIWRPLVALTMGSMLAGGGRTLAAQGVEARLEEAVAAWVGDRPFAGAAVAVTRGAEPLLLRGYGHANLEWGQPTTPGTVFQIASLTKPFTATVVLQLVAEGKLRLDAALGAYVPDLPATLRADRITIRQLLNHTAGTPELTAAGPLWDSLSLRIYLTEEEARDARRQAWAKVAARAEPGERWLYSNTGYDLLGLAVEAVTGAGWADEVRRRIIDPLHLDDTSACDSETLVPRRAAGHQAGGTGGLVNVYSVSQYLRYAYGSLCSSARDLARFAQALASGELLPDSLHRLMITPAGAAERFGYGFGIGVDEFEGRLRLEHGGMVTGFESSLMVLPDDSIAVVVLANANPAGAGSLASELLRIAIGLEPTGEGTLPVGWSAAGRSGGGGGVHWLRRMGSGLHVDSWSDDVFFAPGTTDAASLAYAPTFYPPRGRPEGSLVGIVVASDDPAGPRLFYELDGLGRVGVRLEEAGQTRTVLAPTTPEGGVGRTATMGIRADGDALIIEWGGSEVTRLPLGVVPTRVRVGVSVGSGLSVHVEGAGPSGTGPPARRPGHG